MPKYRFEFLDEPDADPVTIELENEEAAKAEAQRAMAESVLDRVANRQDPRGLAMKIYDEAGYLLATVDFQDFVNDTGTTNTLRTIPAEEPGVKRSG